MKLKLMLICSFLLCGEISMGAAEKSTAKNQSVVETKDSKNYGLNVQPLWILLGGLGIKAEYFLNKQYSLGVDGVYVSNHRPRASSSASEDQYSYLLSYKEINLGTNIMLTGTVQSDGLYLNPSLGYYSTAITEYSDLKLQGSSAGLQARLILGYQWVASSNWHYSAGGGLRLLQAQDIVVKDKAGNELLKEKYSGTSGLALEFLVGYLF
ncbi:MAG: hypothetical protein ACOYOK_15485 [Pseudobdellovibrionaceae bacterium]